MKIVFHHLKLIIDLLDIQEGTTIVDLGCGPGVLIKRILDLYGDVGLSMMGIDFSERAIEQASRSNKDQIELGMLKLLNQNLRHRLPLPDGSIDSIVSNFGIVYSVKEDTQETLSEIMRVLKPGGRLVCSAVIKNEKLSLINLKILRLLGLDLVRKWRQIRLGLHIQKQLHYLFPMYTLSDLCEMVENSGLSITCVEPALMGMSVILVAHKKK